MLTKDWVTKVREIRVKKGVLAAIHYAHQHGFGLLWFLHYIL